MEDCMGANDCMKKELEDYVTTLYRDIPTEVFEGLLSVLCLGGVVVIVFWGFRNGWRKIVGLALVEYVFLIYCSTVIYRMSSETRGHNFMPFWSYERPELMVENIMNVAVFVPVGILLGLAFRTMTFWKDLLIGVAISSSIETMQFYFHRGFAETDDVMHNTVGCIIGCIIVKSARFMVKGFI